MAENEKTDNKCCKDMEKFEASYIADGKENRTVTLESSLAIS